MDYEDEDLDPEDKFAELYETFGKGFDDYEEEEEDDGEAFIQRLTELTKLGQTYLKNKGLTQDEYEAGKAELSKQMMGQLWSGLEIRSKRMDRIAIDHIYGDYDEEEEKRALAEPSIDYDEIDLAVARHQHKVKHGNDAHLEGEWSGTFAEPFLISEKNFGDYKVVIKDVGKNNAHDLPEHIPGSIELKDNGEGLEGTEDWKVLKIDIDIPKVQLRCCRISSMTELEPKYNDDLRSLYFSITSENGFNLDCKFSFEYLCGFEEKKTEVQYGFFGYILELSNVKIRSIDYSRLGTKEEYDRRYGAPRTEYGKLHEGLETSKAVVHKFRGDIYGNYPRQPKSIKGSIIVNFKPNGNLKEEEDKVNLGSPTLPANPNIKLIPQDVIVEYRNVTNLRDEL